MKKFTEYKELNLSKIADKTLQLWKSENTFQRSITEREGAPTFVFYEGPPSANGTPGIHHVMSRAIKDLFCRYKTQQGYKVFRKAGWDTHGLPVELGVEKKMGITKEDIGKTISIEEYNRACREDVMTFTDNWKEMTEKMGYWVDMNDPYVTYENRYIETLWWMLSQLFDKGLLYKGYTIQPYSPAAGTGLSNHELNQPGCYRDVTDTTCIAQFKIKGAKNEYLLAWTTTPWTLPSNTALAVGANINYVKVSCRNQYSDQEIKVILAENLVGKVLDKIEYTVLEKFKGSELIGIEYEQLLPWIRPNGNAFQVIEGDFVTTEDGTGVVHIAPTFGADDDRVAKQNGIVPLHLKDREGKDQPMVDRTGKFFPIEALDPEFVNEFVNLEEYSKWAGKFVKNSYAPNMSETDETVDVEIVVQLKFDSLAFKIERYVHNYPHCWRTDKPILYYPLDSWFIRTTAYKERLIELNSTINWKPASTGEGRFGKWLENLVDWNLSRSRYWGTPLPIWANSDHTELLCIGSIAQLKGEIEKSIAKGYMVENPLKNFVEGDFSEKNYEQFDLHRPYVDTIVLVGRGGERLERELDLIDVWFDSGAMPYAQMHYPFEGTDIPFPADFIAEGVDQTRGWFFTLHALSTMLFDSVSFKNIISNGLVLDKNGNKMSKRLGNGVDPFEALADYGADAVRWYMISNSQPWDNLRFNVDGIDEVRRKFFGTLYNTYSFFALYANVDKFTGDEPIIPIEKRSEIDRWIISLLNSLIQDVTSCLNDYDPTPAARAIATFVDNNLSNWYVRLNRGRFWGGGMTEDKLAAYQTLYTCLETVVKLASPIAPFITEQMYRDLTKKEVSVHLTIYPSATPELIDKNLEQRMELAQRASSMVLSLRRRVSLRVRQPLQKMIIPVLDPDIRHQIEGVEELILSEVNVKEVEYLEDVTGIIIKKIKPNYKTLGSRFGKQMKQVASLVSQLSQEQIAEIESVDGCDISIDGESYRLTSEDFEITSEDMPGWLVATEGKLTIALDIELTPELRAEGLAREFVNRIQNLRRDSGFEVTDKIVVTIQQNPATDGTIESFADYIGSQTLATSVTLSSQKQDVEIEIDEIKTSISIIKN